MFGIRFFFHCRNVHLVDAMSVEEGIGLLNVLVQQFTLCRRIANLSNNQRRYYFS